MLNFISPPPHRCLFSTMTGTIFCHQRKTCIHIALYLAYNYYLSFRAQYGVQVFVYAQLDALSIGFSITAKPVLYGHSK